MLRHPYLTNYMFDNGDYRKSQMSPEDDPTLSVIILMLILLATHIIFG